MVNFPPTGGIFGKKEDNSLFQLLFGRVRSKAGLKQKSSKLSLSENSFQSPEADGFSTSRLSHHSTMNKDSHDTLKSQLLLMASNAEECVKNAIQSLIQRKESLARTMKAQDDVIDQLEIEVDQLAISMLGEATKPEDLRFITMAMRISNELERVGDEATTISRRSLELMKHEPLRLDMPIESMAQMVTDMLREALDTFVYRKPDLAREIVLRDKQVDQLNKAIQAQMTETMLKHPDHIVRSLHLMTIAKSMERIGDHASNIAEQVVFLCEAEDIRHQ